MYFFSKIALMILSKLIYDIGFKFDNQASSILQENLLKINPV